MCCCPAFSAARSLRLRALGWHQHARVKDRGVTIQPCGLVRMWSSYGKAAPIELPGCCERPPNSRSHRGVVLVELCSRGFTFGAPGGNTRWHQLGRRERAAAEDQRREKAIRCRRPSEVDRPYADGGELPFHSQLPHGLELRLLPWAGLCENAARQPGPRSLPEKGAYIYIQGLPGCSRTCETARRRTRR